MANNRHRVSILLDTATHEALRRAAARRHIPLSNLIDQLIKDHLPPDLSKEALVREIKGKYAHVQTSSEDFIRRKHEDLALEDRGCV